MLCTSQISRFIPSLTEQTRGIVMCQCEREWMFEQITANGARSRVKCGGGVLIIRKPIGNG